VKSDLYMLVVSRKESLPVGWKWGPTSWNDFMLTTRTDLKFQGNLEHFMFCK
jgi:hypothetical protein